MSGKIAFTVWRARIGGPPDLYLVDVPDGKPRLLTSNLDITHFALSPDERRVACVVRPRTGKRVQVRIIEADGSRRRTLFRAGKVRGLAWAPDGERLGVAVERGWFSELLAAQADGSGYRRVTWGMKIGDFAWSPDGSIALVSSYGVYRLYVRDAGGGQWHQVISPQMFIFQPTWMPNGEYIAFVGVAADDKQESGLYSIHADGTDLHFVTPLPFRAGFALSPDGSRFAFIGQAPESAEDGALCVIDADGRNLRVLVTDIQWDDRLLPEVPRWTADGEQLAFVSLNEEGAPHLYLVNADGSGRRCLTEGWDMRDTIVRLAWQANPQERMDRLPNIRQPMPPPRQRARRSWRHTGRQVLQVLLVLLIVSVLSGLAGAGSALKPPGVFILSAALLLLSIPPFYLLWRWPPEEDMAGLQGWKLCCIFLMLILPMIGIFSTLYHLVWDYADAPRYGLSGFLGFAVFLVISFGLWIGLIIVQVKAINARSRRLRAER